LLLQFHIDMQCKTNITLETTNSTNCYFNLSCFRHINTKKKREGFSKFSSNKSEQLILNYIQAKGWSKSFDSSLVNQEYLYQTHMKVLIKLCHFAEKDKIYHLEKKTVWNTYIHYKVMVILLISNENFYVAFFAKTKIFL